MLGDSQAADFHFNYYYAAEAIRAGENFYPPDGFVVRGPDDLIIDYVYPPLVALADGAVDVASRRARRGPASSSSSSGSSSRRSGLLGVRDWRCYGLAFLWPPVTDAIATGNISILLGFAAAVVWVYRDRARLAGASARRQHRGEGLPLAADDLARRDPASACGRVERRRRAGGAARLVGGRRVPGLADYPELVRRLSDRMDERGVHGVRARRRLGLPRERRVGAVARVRGRRARGHVSSLARRGDEQRAFVLALAAAIAFSPIVWLHYFALLLVAVAIAQPRLAPVWFIGIPLQVVVSTGRLQRVDVPDRGGARRRRR